MADSKISALTDGGDLQAGDLVAISRALTSFRARAMGNDGWVDDTAETWTYATGSGGGTATFTIAGVDLTAKYTTGTRIKLTQTTVKYFVVISSSFSTNTTVTITAGSSYTLANAAISANYHSYMANPQGYPAWFNFAPSLSGWSGSPTVAARFHVIGRLCTVMIDVSTGTSNSTSATAVAPITAGASAIPTMAAPFSATNAGTLSATPGRAHINASSSTITFTRDWSGAAWTSTGTKLIDYCVLSYEI